MPLRYKVKAFYLQTDGNHHTVCSRMLLMLGVLRTRVRAPRPAETLFQKS